MVLPFSPLFPSSPQVPQLVTCLTGFNSFTIYCSAKSPPPPNQREGKSTRKVNGTKFWKIEWKLKWLLRKTIRQLWRFACGDELLLRAELIISLSKCGGSMTFWCGSGSGSANPSLWLMDPDPAIFVTDLQDANKIQIFYKTFSTHYFWRYIYIIFQR